MQGNAKDPSIIILFGWSTMRRSQLPHFDDAFVELAFESGATKSMTLDKCLR